LVRYRYKTHPIAFESPKLNGLTKYTPHLRKNDYVGALSWYVENASIRVYVYGKDEYYDKYLHKKLS
jgi:hypothetical protein